MLKNYFYLLRIPQWIKNLFVFVPLLFSLHLFESDYFAQTLKAFIMFCLASSYIYILNDIIDIDADASHPKKKLRPLPAGKISIKAAWFTSIIILSLLVILSLFVPRVFIYFLFGFITLNILYSLYFKHIVILDVFSIAAGFTIRVFGGAAIISVPISSWLILTTMFISLFLGVMKRRSELALVSENSGTQSRKVLGQYSLSFADQMGTIAATGVIVCYALYIVAPRTISIFNTERLIYTTPFVVFGIFRFMYLEYVSGKGENTTRTLATDIPMIINFLLYVLATVVIIYKIF